MRINTGTDFDNIPEQDQIRYISVFGDQVKTALNGNVSFLDNIRGSIQIVSFQATAQDVQINHGLNSLPNGYFLIGSSVPMSIYDGVQRSDRTVIYLRSNAIGAAKVFIF